MITDERCEVFIETFDRPKTPFLEELERTALADGIPIIRPQAQGLLRFLVTANEPENILELGTAVGFSSILMAAYAPAGTHIDTIENYDKHIELARANIRTAGMEKRINLIEGDAEEILHRLIRETKQYDMIFIDAAKAQYPDYLTLCRKLLAGGGILVSDNVLFDGDIVQSRFAVRRRDRTIHARMRKFLRMLSEDEDFVTTILPIGDGMTLSVKRKDE